MRSMPSIQLNIPTHLINSHRSLPQSEVQPQKIRICHGRSMTCIAVGAFDPIAPLVLYLECVVFLGLVSIFHRPVE